MCAEMKGNNELGPVQMSSFFYIFCHKNYYFKEKNP